MENLTISYIVPVYNTAKFLPQCIESIESQDLLRNSFEIIIINDGSTDDSLEVAQQLSQKYKNIIIITQKNCGVSISRNQGINLAKGKYIVFVDSDDQLEQKSIKNVIEIAEEYQTQITLYKTMRHCDNGSTIVWRPFLKPNCIVSGEDAIIKGLRISVIWNALYLRTFVLHSNIRFIEGISSGEDVDFGMRLYPLALKIIQTDVLVYHYYSRDNSLMNANDVSNNKRKAKSNLIVACNLLNYANEKLLNKTLRQLYIRMANSLLVSVIWNMLRNRSNYGKTFIKETLTYAIGHNALPIKGNTESWKSNLVKTIINMIYFILDKLRPCR